MADHLGARKNGKFKAVSTAPSINKTPAGSATPPLPYPVTQDLSNSVGTVPNVRFNCDASYVLNQSTQPSCIGDAPGTANGVKSGTVSGEVKPVKGSSTVKIDSKPVIREGDPCTMNGGNCPGIYTTEPAPSTSVAAGAPSGNTNPPAKPETPKEQGFWSKASPWVHGALGVASFVPGVSLVTGAADAAIYAAEGEMLEAGIAAASMIPGGKVVTTAGKAVKGAARLAKGAHATEEAAKAAKLAKEAEEAAKAAKLAKEAEEAAKLKKAEEEAARIRKAEEEAAAAGKGKDGVKVKKQKPHKDCGKVSKYNKAPKKLGELNADHIPSGGALKEAALKKLKGMGVLDDLSSKQIESILNKVYNNAPTITIPEDVHKEGRTWGNKNKPLIAADSKDLKGAFEKDAKAIQKSMDSKDHGCSEAYAKAVEELRKFDYDKYIEDAIKSHKAVKGLL